MELAVFLFTYFFLGIPGTYWVILYVVGKTFSRRTQRCWNREKRFRIDGEIPEISFTNLNLRGGNEVWTPNQTSWKLVRRRAVTLDVTEDSRTRGTKIFIGI